MARTIIRSEGGGSEKKEAAKKTARTAKAAEETVKAAEETVEAAEEKVEETVGKKPNVVTPGKKTGGSSVGFRIGAIVLWLLALACEGLAIMALLKDFIIRFTTNGNTNMIITLILFIVLDLVFAIIAAQLWKKANHINPPSKKNKFTFYLISELGVIMACICFIPLIIILLKNNKLDGKSKTIVAIVAVAALLITGFASADYNPISAEEKAEAEQVITEDVYWTTFGHKYHLDLDCNAIVNSSTVYAGPVAEAIESGRTAICSFCAHRHEGEYDFEKLNVEGGAEGAEKAPETVSVGE